LAKEPRLLTLVCHAERLRCSSLAAAWMSLFAAGVEGTGGKKSGR
jgi:hypothetical protein